MVAVQMISAFVFALFLYSKYHTSSEAEQIAKEKIRGLYDDKRKQNNLFTSSL